MQNIKVANQNEYVIQNESGVVQKDLTRYNSQFFKDENQLEMVKKRNSMLLQFLSKFYTDFVPSDEAGVKRSVVLIKNPHKPVAVFKNELTFTMFVKNFALFICDSHDNTNPVCKIDLNVLNMPHIHSSISAQIREAMNSIVSTKLYKIAKNFSGNEHIFYATTDAEEDYFSLTNPRLYFKYEAAALQETVLSERHSTSTFSIV